MNDYNRCRNREAIHDDCIGAGIVLGFLAGAFIGAYLGTTVTDFGNDPAPEILLGTLLGAVCGPIIGWWLGMSASIWFIYKSEIPTGDSGTLLRASSREVAAGRDLLRPAS